MATSPKMLLMDEPVGGLNPQEIDLVVGIVRRIAAQGITVILIEHVMRFMVQLATRVMIMHHGEKIFEGPPDGLVRDKTVAQVYLGERSARLLAKYLALSRESSAVLEIDNVSAGYGNQQVLHGVSLSVGARPNGCRAWPQWSWQDDAASLRMLAWFVRRAGISGSTGSISPADASTRSCNAASFIFPRAT